MFALRRSYTRRQIHRELGGSVQSYLPTVGGRVVCACLRKDLNPNAPKVILVGNGPVIRRSAEVLSKYTSVIPVFLKRESSRWEFVGYFKVRRVSHDFNERTRCAKQAKWKRRPSMVLHMSNAAGPPSYQAPADADYALTLDPRGLADLEHVHRKSWQWSGWLRHHWPADVIKRGLRLYGFDAKTREFVAVLEVTRGKSFHYTNWRNFAAKAFRATGWRPIPDDPHRRLMPQGSAESLCTGYALRYKLVRRVRIPWEGRFPRLGWLRLSETRRAEDLGDPPKRVAAMTTRVIRDTRLCERLKQLHRHTCQRCGTSLQLPDGGRYSEGHHLKPLGNPHNGPDIAPNVLVLCPNCHALCDLGAIRLFPKKIRATAAHSVGVTFVDYHNARVFKGPKRAPRRRRKAAGVAGARAT